MSGVLLCFSLLYSLETVTLTEPRAVLTDSMPWQSTRLPHAVGWRAHAEPCTAFYMGAGITSSKPLTHCVTSPGPV